MGIVLSINSFHKFTSEIQSEFEFNDNNVNDSVKFGRSDSCDWTLPDPERVVSSVHGELIRFGGDYLIRDLSTNGLFLNRSVTPVGNGNEIKLNDNDIITFGEYEILVELKNSGETTIHPHQEVNASDVFNQIPNDDFNAPTGFNNHTQDHNFASDLSSNLQSNPVFESDIGLTDDFFNLQETHVTDDLVADTPPQPAQPQVAPDFIPEPPPQQHVQPQAHNEPAQAAVATPRVERPSPGRAAPQAQTEKPQVNQPSQAPQAAKPHVAGDTSGEMDAFLSGLGITRNMVPAQHSEEWFKQLGESFALLLGGLMDTLHHRAEFKQTNRLNHTAFQRHENNPLKFSANLEDAIHNLYNRNTASFLAPQHAIQEAFDDIEKHEKALMLGVDGAVRGVMGLLNPDYISTMNAGDGVLEKIIPGKTQANFWKNYERQYSDLSNELEESSTPFYLEDFAKSYEMALKKG